MYLVAILWITVKRIFHNWKVVGALLGGLVLAAGVMAAIPIYSAGSLQSSFFREWMTQDSFRPPFTLIVTHTNERRGKAEALSSLNRMERSLDRDIRQAVGRAPLARSDYASIGDCVLQPRDAQPDLSFSAPRAELSWMTGVGNLAQIAQGRWYQPRTDGIVEVVVDETTLEQTGLLVGQKLTAWYELQDGELSSAAVNGAVPIPIEVVGFFRARPGFTTKDWIYPPPFFNRLFVEPSVFRDDLMGRRGLRAERWDMEWVFSPEPVQVALLPGIISHLEAAQRRATQVLPNTVYWLSPVDFFRSYNERADRVALFLAALATPLMGMILYYIVLMAGVAVQHRSKEILVMHSRGAGRLQAVLSFFLEWLLLGAVAFLVGPFLGVFIARAMGASSGFLSFVDREAIPAFASPQAYRFSLAASLIALAAGMGPVFATFRHTIVTFSRRGARRTRSLWHRLFLDVILLAVAAVAYRELMWQSTRLAPDETVAADPILFFVPVVFLLGAGLLLLRIYPFLLAGLRWISGWFRGVVWQLSLRRLTRNAVQYFPLLLLLILTLSLGIYSASSARTLSRNFDDRIRFEVGADLAVKEEWHPPDRPATGEPTSEPPFLKRLDLPGVLSAARVLKDGVDVTVGGQWELANAGVLMAISPAEFEKTAWFRSDFAKAPLVDYLSLLARHHEGVIVSTKFYNDQQLTLGQELHFVFHEQPFDAYVAGVVDLWPTLDPSRSPFFILNIDYVLENIRLEPYEVWYRLANHDHVQEMVTDMTDLGVYPTQVRDAEAMITALKHEPYRMGFFGVLSLSFVIAALITVLGFLVYTYFSIRGRLLQFGALRAMGLSRLQLTLLLVLEQLFTLGAGLAAGVFLGSLCSRLFLPFLRARAAELQPVPPFLLISDRTDILYVLAVLGALFVAAVVGLTVILARLKINRALTLGEEVEP